MKPASTASATSPPFWLRRDVVILIVILSIAAALRLVNLTHAPPGLNQDEAANAWNAYCLLKTGRDQAEVPWPIFYSRGLGANRSTLYLYALLPFQYFGGLNPLTTRLPAAVGGILTVLLVYAVGRRLFGRPVGLVGAALLTLSPWHIQLSRWGHEASLVPLLVIAPVYLWLLADLPITADRGRRPRAVLALLAGAVTGICCYGYPAVRIFLPLFLVGTVVITWRGWWDSLKSRRGAVAVLCFVLAVAATLGPLAWKHLADPEGIGARAASTWVWRGMDSSGEKVLAALSRYPGHFGLDFLFLNGDRHFLNSVPRFGQLHWYMLPLMIIGVLELLRRVPSSRAARILLLWLILYPVSDCLNSHMSLNALRSAPGLCGLILLAALGTARVIHGLSHLSRWRLQLTAAVALIPVLAMNAGFLHKFFVRYPRMPIVFQGFQTDLVAACHWLREEFDRVDAVYCTTHAMNSPYVVTLVGLGYDPVQWFRDEKVVERPNEWDVYLSYGKMHFLYGQPIREELQALRDNGRPDRVIFIVRPHELGLRDPVRVISGPDTLWICDLSL